MIESRSARTTTPSVVQGHRQWPGRGATRGRRWRSLAGATAAVLAVGVTNAVAPVQALPLADAPGAVVFVAGPWVSTGISVQAGATLDIRANGRALTYLPFVWNGGSQSGPNGQDGADPCTDHPQADPTAVCAMDGQPFGALVGRIGNQTFFVGADATIAAPMTGELELAVNDYTIYYGDNSGGYAVQVR
jgi:PA-IL-like protein